MVVHPAAVMARAETAAVTAVVMDAAAADTVAGAVAVEADTEDNR
jgi:hypothetical protein